MPQRLANVELTQSFNAWRVRTNDTVDFINQLANTTGVAQVTSANATFTNIITLSGNSTFSGNVVTFAASVVNTNILSSNVKISGNLTMTSTGAVKVPSGTTAQRGAHNSVGHFRYNTSTSTFEGYTVSGWIQFQSIGSAVSNSTFQSALANTNAYIASVSSTVTSNRNTAKSELANTNAYIASNRNTAKSELANTNAYIASVSSTVTSNRNTAKSELANTNAYIAATAAAAPVLASNNNFTSTNQFRLGAPVKTTTSNSYSLLAADAGFYHRLDYANTTASGSTTIGITIPANSTTSIPIGSEYLFVRTGSNSAFQFSNAAGVIVNSDGGKLRVKNQWQSAVCKKVATDEWDLIGNLST